MRGFKAFLLRGNVVDLAIAVVIGVAFTTVVTAFVKDLVTPLIAALGGKPDFASLYFTINSSKFMVGDFINELISFVIIAAAVYFAVVLPVNKLISHVQRPAAPTTKTCPECLSAIPIGAKRCAHCTSPVAA